MSLHLLIRRAPILLSLALVPTASAFASPFISELHYDNSGTDIDERIEVELPTGENLAGWRVELYNGSNGSRYAEVPLADGEQLTCAGGRSVVTLAFATNGIQNGPDGLALVDPADNVVEFLSYEGSFAATDGLAAGLTSVDMGVSESSSTTATQSLQKVNGAWNEAAENSFGACNDQPAPPLEPPFISELHYDNAGADVGEAIEVEVPPGATVGGWSLVLYNGNNGAVYNTIALSDDDLVECEGQQGRRVLHVDLPSNGLQNGAPDGLALVDDNQDVREFLSYEGSFTAADGPAQGLPSIDIEVSEASDTPVGQSLQKVNGAWNAPASASFGQCNEGGSNGSGPLEVKIHEIQGSGDTALLQNAADGVAVEAVVTASYQDSTQLRGFFIQEEDADADGDSATSEAIFVFCDDCSTLVSVGDKVRVVGKVGEFFEMSQIGQLESVEVLDSNLALPSAAVVSLPVAVNTSSAAEADAQINAFYESIEAMRVRFEQPLVVSEYFQLGRFGQVVLYQGERPFQFTQTQAPSEAGLQAHRIDLASRRVILDDDNNRQNAPLDADTPVPFPDPGFAVDNYFRGGDRIEALEGVLHWSWAGSEGTNAWRVRVSSPPVFTPANPRSLEPSDVQGRLKVASVNVLNYFTTLDVGGDVCGPSGGLGCRGAHSAVELTRQGQKLAAAICAMDADIVGVNEIENNEEASLRELVRVVNESCGGYSFVASGTVGTDAIKNGLLYKSSTVAPDGAPKILDSDAFVNPNNLSTPKNRAALAQRFQEVSTGSVLTVVVNHLKSKGSSCGEGDDSQADGQGNCNQTRTLAATEQIRWIDEDITSAGEAVLVIGDLNAYRKEDPVTAFTQAGYVDTIEQFEGDSAYGYIFDGQRGTLDYALANAALAPHVTGATSWNINADEVNLLDYNDSVLDGAERPFERKSAATQLFAPDAYRSSDHDPVIVGIDLPEPARVAPRCRGREATVYVDENNQIVGGLLDGRRYRGLLMGTRGDDVIVGVRRRFNIIFGLGGNDRICRAGFFDRIIY